MNPGPESNKAREAGIVTALAELPRDSHLDKEALARILGRSTKTIDRAVRRGELPAPIRFLGKKNWLVGTILDHLNQMQTAALKAARQRRENRVC